MVSMPNNIDAVAQCICGDRFVLPVHTGIDNMLRTVGVMCYIALQYPAPALHHPPGGWGGHPAACPRLALSSQRLAR